MFECRHFLSLMADCFVSSLVKCSCIILRHITSYIHRVLKEEHKHMRMQYLFHLHDILVDVSRVAARVQK